MKPHNGLRLNLCSDMNENEPHAMHGSVGCLLLCVCPYLELDKNVEESVYRRSHSERSRTREGVPRFQYAYWNLIWWTSDERRMRNQNKASDDYVENTIIRCIYLAHCLQPPQQGVETHENQCRERGPETSKLYTALIVSHSVETNSKYTHKYIPSLVHVGTLERSQAHLDE